LKVPFFQALLDADQIQSFKTQKEFSCKFLENLPGFKGAMLRAYSGKHDSAWIFFSSTPRLENKFLDICDFSQKISDDNTEDLLSNWHHKKVGKEKFKVFISPYIIDNSHLGDLVILTDDTQSDFEWHLLSDLLCRAFFVRFEFAGHLRPVYNNDAERLLSFIRETQMILTARKRVMALTIEQEKLQAQQWFEEDQPILSRFMSRVKKELNLYGIFILQNAAPGFFHQLTLISQSSNESSENEIDEMIEAVKQYDSELNISILSKWHECDESSLDHSVQLVPMVFSCQAGKISFGHLGLLTTRANLSRYLNHRSKILPMLANQLGFYFSHLFQLRREALEARMLQQINQTCNTINSSVDIGAILFKLVESLNNLFRQYSGAILINSVDNQKLEVTTGLGGPIPENFNIQEVIDNHPQIVDLINEGAVFDNRDGHYSLPIRYILPLSATPQAQVIASDLMAPRSLGAVILYEHPTNKPLAEETLQKLIPILLNGIGASLQVARNYAEKLETIMALEGLMSKLSDSDSLFDEMIAIIKRLLRVNRISFLTLDESERYLYIKKEFGLPAGIKETTRIPIGDEISGYVARHGKSIRIDNIEREGLFKKRSMEDYLNRSLLSVPLISKRENGEEKIIGVINVNNKTNGLTFTQQDQQLLEAIAHLVVTALEKVRYLEEKHEKELLDRQLKDAKDVQMSLLPKSFDNLPKSIEMFGQSIPARQIGGDFFDVIKLDDGKIIVVLGDVSGKGMPAAILMAASRMIIRSVVQDSTEPTAILEKVNARLTDELDSYHFVTVQIVKLDPDTGESEMSSAGHGPLMVCLGGKIQLIETRGGPPLGIPGLSGHYDKRHFQLSSSDCFIMYTDGLSEEYSSTREMFGEERIEKYLLALKDKSAQEITEGLIDAAIEWRGNKEAHDDLTLVCIKHKGSINESV
jgi:sigma-B regulation protein RsbU (phosphoserine phosphatase)